MKLLRAIWRRLRPPAGQWVRIEPMARTTGTAGGSTVSMVVYLWTATPPRYEWRSR